MWRVDRSKKISEVIDSVLYNLEELVFVDLVSPLGLPQLVDSFDSIRQSLIGFLVYVHFLDITVFAPALEGGYLDFEGFSGRPRRGRTSFGRGP
jgi:hypothetical protein